MSKFYNLDMAKEVALHPQIVEASHFFGLLKDIVYAPTSSQVESYSNFYNDNDAQLFKLLIDSPTSKLEESLKPLETVETTDDGRYRLDLCISHDGQFIAMQLNRIAKDVTTHITPIRYFVGKDAERVDQIF